MRGSSINDQLFCDRERFPVWHQLVSPFPRDPSCTDYIELFFPPVLKVNIIPEYHDNKHYQRPIVKKDLGTKLSNKWLLGNTANKTKISTNYLELSDQTSI